MKLPLLLALALACTACDKVIFSPEATPAPATPVPATPAASPTPKPGAWMRDSKTSLDKSGKLGEKGKK